jgi:hypothetical protein
MTDERNSELSAMEDITTDFEERVSKFDAKDDIERTATSYKILSNKKFVDSSTECAICLGKFLDEDNEGDDDEKIVVLECGHKWHLQCIIDQLQQTKPNYTSRLIFNGCRCAKCGTYCTNHPELNTIARTTDELRHKVDILIREQVQIDGYASTKMTTETANPCDNSGTKIDWAELIEKGRRKYAFYLCSSCNDPYFGGTIDCFDDETTTELAPDNPKLCPTCLPQVPAARALPLSYTSSATSSSNGSSCRSPASHRQYHIWKCRYCCSPSSYVCYGNVHFCSSCHDRNSQLVALQRSRKNNNNNTDDELLSSLSCIPCPGGDLCPHPKPTQLSASLSSVSSASSQLLSHQQNHDTPVAVPSLYHRNGSTFDCEQVYYCAMCMTNERTNSNGLEQQEQQRLNSSKNLLKNPCGQTGDTRDWNRGERQWKVETLRVPSPYNSSSCFVSSFVTCTAFQQVFLKDYIRSADAMASTATHQLDQNDISIRVVFEAYYIGRTDCPSEFCLEGLIIKHDDTTNDHGTVQQRLSTGMCASPVDEWERASLQYDFLTLDQARKSSVVFAIHGKDCRFWYGNYGSKVTDCSLRIVLVSSDVTSAVGITNGNIANDPVQLRQILTPNSFDGHYDTSITTATVAL